MGNTKRNASQESEPIGTQVYRRKIICRALVIGSIVLFLCLLCVGGVALANYLYFDNEHFVCRRLIMVPTVHFNGEKTQQLLAGFSGEANCVIGRSRLTRINLSAIRQEFMKSPLLEEVQVRRQMPDALVITLKERIPLAYVCGNRKNTLRLIDRNGVLFPYTGRDSVPPDLPFITRVSKIEERKNGVPIDDFMLKNAIELVLLVNGKEPVERAGYSMNLVQLNAKYQQFECQLKPMPDNKVFSKSVMTILLPSEIDKMRSGLERLDAILIRKLQDKETISYADLTLERNVNTRD